MEAIRSSRETDPQSTAPIGRMNFLTKAITILLFLLSLASVGHGFTRPLSAAHRSPRTAQPAVIATAALHALNPATICRGGVVNAAFDLGRESYKLQSMATYSTITALVMNACLRLYTSQKFARTTDEATGQKRPRTPEYVFQALAVLCIVSGVFTALLFNILGIYSKESLGLANHAGYLAFRDATAQYRKNGFRAFLTTCVSFVGVFGLSVWERTKEGDRKGQVILVGSIVLALLGAYHIHAVLRLATKFIYTPENCAINHIA